MASSSSSSLSRTRRHRVFTSFHGQDVRKTFLSHLRKQFSYNGISMFDDQGIERGQTISPELIQAIWEARISIVVLSQNYASSSWCLKELVEILMCKKDMGQIVMTVFHGVDPSDVRNQTGEFGRVFNETCIRKTEEEKGRWSRALTDVGNIAGEDFQNWVNEVEMIEDVLDKLNATPSRDFDGMVGLETHIREMMSLLDLDYDGVKVVAIYGPARLPLLEPYIVYFLKDNLRGSYHNGFDGYGSKLRLQEKFLSKILNHNSMRICHLGAVQENLSDQKVLIILDDLTDIIQLEALVDETWFGPKSRIIVTTENRELLQQHGIDITYNVGFPYEKEALEILCRYAFRQASPFYGFDELCRRITKLCGNLPLGLRVVGSSLRGKTKSEWEDVMNTLETRLARDIEDVLRVSYESLEENEQTLFLHIAIFFNNEDSDLVKAMFAGDRLDVKHGLKILVYRSLIEISTHGKRIHVHKLLQQMARQAIRKQEPWKRQILTDVHDICDFLENESGSKNVVGISFDTSGTGEVFFSERAFKRMPNLRFLRVYKRRYDQKDRMQIPEEMEFSPCLRLLDWDAYPSKFLPHTFHPEYLVKLKLETQLDYLWQGTQLLTNLKKMDLSMSFYLKELPDLSNATNLEELELRYCESLVEIPSSFSYLQKLKKLRMEECINLQVFPPQLNLASLEILDLRACSRLRHFSVISTNIRDVDISETAVEDLPPSISLCSWLDDLAIGSCRYLKEITHLSTSIISLDLSYSEIEKIPDCIKTLHQLYRLNLCGCRRLTLLPELPRSLKFLEAQECESLETIYHPLNHGTYVRLDFTNCFKLGQQALRAIFQSSLSGGCVILPGIEVPAKFDNRAIGNSLTIFPAGNSVLPPLPRLELFVVVSPNQISECRADAQLFCQRVGKGNLDSIREVFFFGIVSKYRYEHLVIFDYDLPFVPLSEVNNGIVLEFSCTYHSFDIIECGGHISTEGSTGQSYELELGQVYEDNHDSLSSESSEFESCEAFENCIVYGGEENDILTNQIFQPSEAFEEQEVNIAGAKYT